MWDVHNIPEISIYLTTLIGHLKIDNNIITAYFAYFYDIYDSLQPHLTLDTHIVSCTCFYIYPSICVINCTATDNC